MGKRADNTWVVNPNVCPTSCLLLENSEYLNSSKVCPIVKTPPVKASMSKVSHSFAQSCDNMR